MKIPNFSGKKLLDTSESEDKFAIRFTLFVWGVFRPVEFFFPRHCSDACYFDPKTDMPLSRYN